MVFIEKIAQCIENKYDLSKDMLTIVFPNKRAAVYLRKALADYAQSSGKTIWIPKISSIQEAIEHWSGFRLIDNVETIFELLAINAEIKNKNTPDNEFFQLAGQIAKDFDEIDQYGVNAENIFSWVSAAKQIKVDFPTIDDDEFKESEKNSLIFFRSLIEYYKRLHERLNIRRCGYYGMLTRMLSESISERKDDITRDGRIIFAGFNAMTPTEQNIIRFLVDNDKADIFWDLDRYYLDDERQEAGVFARQFFKKYKNTPTDFIGNELLEGKKTINIIGVSGQTVQTEALRLMLEKEDISTQKSEVVVLADENLLTPVVNSIPEKAGKIRVSMGYPFVQTELYRFIRQVCVFQKTLGKKAYLWSLMKVVNTDFTRAAFSQKDSEALHEWIMQLALKKVCDIEDEHISYLKNIEIQNFIRLIIQKWDIQSSEGFVNFIEKLPDFGIFETVSAYMTNQFKVVKDIARKIRSVFDNSIVFSCDNIVAIFDQVARESKLEHSSSRDGLQIMGLLETRNLDFKTVHILSVNEKILPKAKESGSLIPFDTRKVYGLPVYSDQQNVYSYHFYRLLQNAENINIYYNNSSIGLSSGEESRYIRQIETELKEKNENVTINRISFNSPEIGIGLDAFKIEKDNVIMAKTRAKMESGLSPTSISAYLKCPVLFCLRYIFDISRDELNEQIQTNVLGTIVHETLEELYRKFGNDIINEAGYDAMVNKYLKSCLDKILDKNNFSTSAAEKGFNKIARNIIDEMLDRFVSAEKKFLKKENILKIIDLECEMKHNIANIDGCEVCIKGFADRIDQVGNEIRIIDYKTGRVMEKDVKVNNEELAKTPEKAIQLMIYKYLFIKTRQDKDMKINPSIIALQDTNHGPYNLIIDEKLPVSKDFMSVLEQKLKDVMTEILNQSKAFEPTDDESNCSRCDFCAICGRG